MEQEKKNTNQNPFNTMIQIEKALTTHGNKLPLHWFLVQNHIPFDLSKEQYNKLYKEFLQELYQLYIKTNSEYYWFKNGKLLGDKDIKELEEWDKFAKLLLTRTGIKLNKQLLRDIKLEELLKNN